MYFSQCFYLLFDFSRRERQTWIYVEICYLPCMAID